MWIFFIYNMEKIVFLFLYNKSLFIFKIVYLKNVLGGILIIVFIIFIILSYNLN